MSIRTWSNNVSTGIASIDARRQATMNAELVNLLRDRPTRHILKSDKACSAHLLAKGAK